MTYLNVMIDRLLAWAKDVVASLAAQIDKAHKTRNIVVVQPPTYTKGGGASYFRDLTRYQIGMADADTEKRLQRHIVDVATHPAFRESQLYKPQGSGSRYIPPLWIIEEINEMLPSMRPYATLAGPQPLPAGTDSINIPMIATQDEAGSVPFINAPVRTLAGQQAVALGLLDQSRISFDAVILRDLMSDYATRLDLQVIDGTGRKGQLLGVRSTLGIHRLVISGDADTTYAQLGNAIHMIHTSRYLPPDVIIMHPRRWAALIDALSLSGHKEKSFFNDTGVETVGELWGLPVVCDANMPVGLGDNDDQDAIHLVRTGDLELWESGFRARVLPDRDRNALIQMYAYSAFTAARFASSIAEITGPALSKPTFGVTA